MEDCEQKKTVWMVKDQEVGGESHAGYFSAHSPERYCLAFLKLLVMFVHVGSQLPISFDLRHLGKPFAGVAQLDRAMVF